MLPNYLYTQVLKARAQSRGIKLHMQHTYLMLLKLKEKKRILIKPDSGLLYLPGNMR